MDYYANVLNLTGNDYDPNDYLNNPIDYYPITLTPEENFVYYLYVIVFPYFLFFGTIGNVISIAIMKKYSHNVWSTCMYMTLLFPMDLIRLYVECGNDWYKKIHDDREDLSRDILHLSNAVCKVYSFTYNLLLHEAVWLMVASGIETTIGIRQPLWIYEMCTRERGSAVSLFITVMLISLNLHFFWTTGLTQPGDDPTVTMRVCTYINELSDQFRDYIWPLINFFIGEALPFVALILCLVLSVTKLQVKGYKAAEQDRFLEKYFLDIKTLNELKKAMFIITVLSTLILTCSMLKTGLMYFNSKEVITMTWEGSIMSNALIACIMYICLSHKFWVFYFCCSKFRNDVRDIGRCIWRPIAKRCFNTRSNRILLDRHQTVAVSWHESDNEGTYTPDV